jgi:hypothetical protein
MNSCKLCGKEYDVKEVVRVFGDTDWKHLYCSAICFTKALMAKKESVGGMKECKAVEKIKEIVMEASSDPKNLPSAVTNEGAFLIEVYELLCKYGFE